MSIQDVTHNEVTKKKTVNKTVNNQCACCRNIEVATGVQAAAARCDATPTRQRGAASCVQPRK